jgi:hypothetical protein
MDGRSDPEGAAIEALVQDYFLGMYEGDVERLRRIFNPQCWLFGENHSGSLEFPLAGFLELIESEPVPKAEGRSPLSGPPVHRLPNAPKNRRGLEHCKQGLLLSGLITRRRCPPVRSAREIN